MTAPGVCLAKAIDAEAVCRSLDPDTWNATTATGPLPVGVESDGGADNSTHAQVFSHQLLTVRGSCQSCNPAPRQWVICMMAMKVVWCSGCPKDIICDPELPLDLRLLKASTSGAAADHGNNSRGAVHRRQPPCGGAV